MRALLVLAVFIYSSATVHAAGDALQVRAAICTDKRCTRRAQVSFGPAPIEVEVLIAADPRNRKLQIGYVCDGDPTISEVDLDGRTDPPLVTRSYRDVGPGECMGVAQLLRADGTALGGQSVTLRLVSRF